MGTNKNARSPRSPQTDRSPQHQQAAQGHAQHMERIQARNRRIALLAVSVCLCLTVVAGIAAGLILWLREPSDDGKILPNVTVGGVNIGGMTPDEAINALQVSVREPLGRKDMVVTLPGASLVLAAKDTQADLDLESLVDTAYAYGRTGTRLENAILRTKAETTAYIIPLLPYLELDQTHIEQTVEDFCGTYSIEISQPTVSIQGNRPEYPSSEEDAPVVSVPVVHQVMTITTGTPQFVLDANDLYDAILDAYSLFQLEVSYEAPNRIEPDPLDLAAIFEAYCVAPVDAVLDPVTFDITPEVVGYGFDIAAVQALLEDTGYGQELLITLDFILPDITAKSFGPLFQDILGSCTSAYSDAANANWNTNLQLSCAAINGYVIKAGESFNFNKVLGPRTTDKGYVNAPNYSGSTAYSIGGGIDQTASALYYSALQAGLQIDERHAHRYSLDYTPIGTDAAIDYGKENLIFTNNTAEPIRIMAQASGNTVTIQLLGTEARPYRAVVEVKTVDTVPYGKEYQIMSKDNVMGYTHGQVLTSGVTGYEAEVYLCQYDPQTNDILFQQLLYSQSYDMRNEVVVQIEGIAPEPTETEPPVTDPDDPTEPTEPTEPTTPSVTEPSASVEPVLPEPTPSE